MGLSRSLFAPLTSRLMPWREYYQRVFNTRPDALVQYVPLWEPSGATANDYSKNAHNGTYTNVTLAQRGIGDGRTCPIFPGAGNSRVNLYSAALAAAFNKTEGTLCIVGKIKQSLLADGLVHCLVSYGESTQNSIVRIRKSNANNIYVLEYKANGTSKSVNVTTASLLWLHWCITWSLSANQVKVYLNGAQQGATQTGLGTWTAALSTTWCNAGDINSAGAQPWRDYLAHMALWSVALPASAIAYLGRYATD